ncbi:flagellar motor switch protein FliN [Desulfocucumis palustris]|uniref:Flagellar motor switch protein FliN n=1 Tax=Desulfocucumis palustris TaxID=1898651 RepID=A0A2L2XAJ5_9FIRM|nr:FliM/FliN family flagellar motor switch protein [Desulfocucumis palustris]GBF33198.1 flagellar motor switch protein FliN [Desulfocucumis palustris]
MMKEEELKEFLNRMQESETSINKVDFPSFDRAPFMDKMRVSVHYLENIQVNITAELGASVMKIRDIIKIGEDSVIELDQPVGETAEIYVNNQPLGRGEIVVIGNNFGIRMETIYKKEENDPVVSEP